MVLILVVLTVAILIAVDLFVTSRKRQRGTAPAYHVSIADRDVTERLFHPAHTWATVGSGKLVTVGFDDFAQRMMGGIEAVSLPAQGTFVHQGEPMGTLRHGRRMVSAIAPVSGLVAEINTRLEKHPWLVNASPYQRGWIAKISPADLRHELHNLLHGVTAERWREAVRMQLVQMFTPARGVVLQDGGQLVEDIGMLLSDEEWERMAREFFPMCFLQPRNAHHASI
jgi:glycine cleavage system H protein